MTHASTSFDLARDDYLECTYYRSRPRCLHLARIGRASNRVSHHTTPHHITPHDLKSATSIIRAHGITICALWRSTALSRFSAHELRSQLKGLAQFLRSDRESGPVPITNLLSRFTVLILKSDQTSPRLTQRTQSTGVKQGSRLFGA